MTRDRPRPILALLALLLPLGLLACDSGGSNPDTDPPQDNPETTVDNTTADLGQFDNTDPTTASTIDAEAYSELTDGSEVAADTTFPSVNDAVIDTITNQRNLDITITPDQLPEGTNTIGLRAKTTRNNDTETASTERNVTFTTPDEQAPTLNVTATEPDDTFGHITLQGDTDEQANITAYLLNPDETDSTQVLTQDNTQMFDATIRADQLNNQIGDQATLTIQATDQAGNTTTEQAHATIDGTDVNVTTLKSNSEPNIGNQPTQAYVTTPDTTLKSTTQGEATLDNLTPGDTVKVNDELQKGPIGDFYRANIPITTEKDTSFQALMLENINLAQGDNFYNNSRELILDATDGFMRMVPNGFKPDWNQTTDEFFPVTYAINQNGKNLPDDHKEKLKEGIRSWNGPDGQYDNARIIDDTTEADITVRIEDSGTRYLRQEKVIQIAEPTSIVPPEATGKSASHELTHSSELAPFNSGHLNSKAYVSNTNRNRPLNATKTEVKALNLMQDSRSVLDAGRDISEYWSSE